MRIISKCSCRPHNTTWQAMGWRPTIYNLTVQMAFTLHFYRLNYRFMPQFGNQAVYTKVITTNLMFLNKAFPHSMLNLNHFKSLPMMTHFLRIIFSSVQQSNSLLPTETLTFILMNATPHFDDTVLHYKICTVSSTLITLLLVSTFPCNEQSF